MKSWVSAFSAGFSLAVLILWLPGRQQPATAAPPAIGPVLRADTFARVARDRERSVVFLHTVSSANDTSSRSVWPQSPTAPQPGVIETIREGLGSGVVIDAGGLILTNAHVVRGADAIHVRMADGEDVDATIVGTDTENDIALLRASEARGLRPAPLGDSDRINVGDIVVAIGNPLGLHYTVTTGVISAKARGLDDSGIEFLQTDAAINPGSSGGPLLDLNGAVIGLTTAILSKFGDNAGLNFAIPINSVKAVLPQLRTDSVTHGWLGVATRALNPRGVQALGIEAGLLVTDLYPEGPAARAGLRLGDVLLGITAPAAVPPREIHRRIRETVPGATVTLRVWRDRQQLSVPVVIQARPKKQ